MVGPTLVLLRRTGLSCHVYSKTPVMGITFHHLPHPLMDGIPVRRLHVNDIPHLCMIVRKLDSVAVRDPIDQCEVIAGTAVGHRGHIPGKSYRGKAVVALSDC